MAAAPAEPALRDNPEFEIETDLRAKGRAVVLLESQSDGSAFRPRFICGRGKTAWEIGRAHV